MSETAVEIPGYVAGTWAIDPVHSEVSFVVRHMMVSKVRGRFDKFEGTIVTAADPLQSSVTATVDLSSVNTGEPNRDNHIRSADFFEVESHPTLLSGFTALARDVVPDEVIEVQRAQRLGHVAVSGVDRVVDQHGQMGDVPPGLGRMPLGSLSRRDGAQQLPEKLHVEVVQRAPYGEVMQLTRGQRVQFITGHPWTLPPAPCGSRGATSSWGRAVTTPERADGPRSLRTEPV